MRILWVCPYPPIPRSGAGTRVFNLLRVLSSGNEIDLIARARRGEMSDGLLENLRACCRSVQVEVASEISPRRKRLLQLRSLVDRRPMQYRLFFTPGVQVAIDRALDQRTYDVVMLEHSFMGYYSFHGHALTVIDQHNVESEIFLRSGQAERSLVRRAYNWIEYWKYRSDERRFCRSADLVLAVSDRDRATMVRWGAMPSCVVIPNGVDTRYFMPTEEQDKTVPAAHVLFTGTMNYSPNIEAMLYFCAEIWPRVLEREPEATLQIVGHSPPPEIVKLSNVRNVSVVGSVPDVRAYLARAQVVVAPLRIGGGTRLKILEAMAMARPVVSTSLGCEGLDLEAGKHLLVADQPEAFALQVTELLRDRTQRAALGGAARGLVTQQYDWRALGGRMEHVLCDALRARAE